MKQYKYSTVIIPKEGWKYLLQRAFSQGGGGRTLPEESIERAWKRIASKNGGASPTKNPIAEDEIRVDMDTFGLNTELIKKLLDEQGISWREDGFITEGIYV